MARVRLSSLRLFALKLGIFSTVLLYLAVDLWFWHGPVWSYIHKGAAEKDTSKLVATVYGEDLSKEQLSRLRREMAWLRGLNGDEEGALDADTCLMELMNRSMLRIATRYNDKNLPLCREEAEAEVAGLASRADSDEAFDAQLRSQGYTRKSFTDKVQARMRSRALLERAVAEHCDVSDEAVALHYELVRDSLRLPERRMLHHIFFAFDGKDADDVQARAEATLRALEAGADFESLARERSEDERSAPQGGALGIIPDSHERLLPELPLFGAEAIPAGKPTLAQSRWGWHILLAGPVEAARTPTLEECRESLRSAIRSAQREIAVGQYFDTLFDEALQKKRIRIYAH